ncbi:MAG: glycosyltransferase [Candidatus Omnitrophica bacterium]|nr:glycosyltransferase [Candidatus Omnitrophota bacterium]
MVKVSVIIPTYNRGSLIARALNSVLSQSFKDFEIIVIDDGSKDNTQTVLNAFDGKIRYVYQANGGIARARNRGIELAKGAYIAFLDSDDYWAPEKLAVQVKILDANPKVGIVYGRMPIVNEAGDVLGMKPNGISGKNFHELLRVWGDLPTSSVMTRKECFVKAGVFDPELPPMEDIDMWIRIAHTYDLYEVEGKTLAYYWRHDHQITQDQIKVHRGLVRIHEKILRTFKEAPKTLITKKLVSNQYLLSRLYYNKGMYRDALYYLTQGIKHIPFAGTVFIEPSDSVIQKTLKIIKPYGFLVACSIKCLVNPKKKADVKL